MWRLMLNFFKTRSLILYWSMKLLWLSSKLSRIIIFILNTPRGCSMQIQICSMRIKNTQRATSAWILLVNSRRGKSYWLIPSLALFFVALATSRRHQMLLYAHSKCVRSCSMLIQNMAEAALFYHVGTQSNTTGFHDVNISAPAIFWTRIEEIRICFEHTKCIQN
jgi:hypothetical protein